MTKLAPSVSLYIRLKDKPVGHRFSTRMTPGERILIHQWIRTGHIKKAMGRGGFEIVKKIEPIMHTQKIHDYIMSRLSFTTMEIAKAIDCSHATVTQYVRNYGRYYNLESETTTEGIRYRRRL